jgi:acyl-coenzyme A thioesterase PaaI-like protein
MNHRTFRLLLNVYPPYWATGISVTKVTPDFREVIVEMKMRFYNRNYVHTHFGGSLYAMADPFYMLMLIQILGKEYVVWDKSASIDFIRPGKGTVTARFVIDQDTVSDILKNTNEGQKFTPTFTVDVIDEEDKTVARVFKTLYIRKKVKTFTEE